MRRYPDWDVRLDAFLRESRSKRFQYGQTDCCLFVADAVLVMTGTDLAAPFRGQYGSRREALRMAKAYSGFGSVRALVLKALHSLPSVSPLSAQRGDIALIKRDRDYSLGLVALNGRELIKAAETGVISKPLSMAVKAWHV